MRVVFISGCNTQQRTLINSLASYKEIDLCVVRLLPDQANAPAQSLVSRLLKNPIKLFARKLESWNFSRRERARQTFMNERFGEQSLRGVREITVQRRDVNAATTISMIQALDPEIMIVCGAPILKPPIIAVPKIAGLNIHFGSAPRYRGEHCLFWALFRRDYEHVEVSVHQLTAALDHGDIYLQGRPQLSSLMHEFEIEAQLVEYLCSQLSGLLGRIIGGAFTPLRPQLSVGELFRLRDRTLLSDLRYALSRRLHLPGRACVMMAKSQPTPN